VLSGSGLFALFGAPFAQSLIENLGWRAAGVGIALLPLLLGGPLVYHLFRGDDGAASAGGLQAAAGGPVVSRAEALRGYRFWVIAAAFGLASLGVGAFNANLVGVLGVPIALGRLAIGFVIDRVGAPGVAACVLSLPAIGAAFVVGGTLLLSLGRYPPVPPARAAR
jgi:hypothetical protein